MNHLIKRAAKSSQGCPSFRAAIAYGDISFTNENIPVMEDRTGSLVFVMNFCPECGERIVVVED